MVLMLSISSNLVISQDCLVPHTVPHYPDFVLPLPILHLCHQIVHLGPLLRHHHFVAEIIGYPIKKG